MLGVLAGAFAVMAFIGTAGAGAAGDPLGDHGTMKIDGVERVQHPDVGGATPGGLEGPSAQATDTSPPASSGDLPWTGSDSAPLAAIALGLVVLGGAGIFAARHLRTAGE